MLTEVGEGVLTHQSDFMQSNAVVVQSGADVLLIDAGISGAEIAGIANDLHERGHRVAAGFSTHPHWDHLLWHVGLGDAPRYGTARCAAAVQARLSDAEWKAAVAGMIPPDIVDLVPLDDSFGRIVGLPAESTLIPWGGPDVRVIEHRAHCTGHAALVIEVSGVLVAGDMLSDALIPMLDFRAADPIEDYLAALQLLDGVASGIDVVVPGHGSVGGAGQLRERIDRDRAYLHALREGTDPTDPRIGPSAKPGWEWVSDVHAGQRRLLSERGTVN
jgi:glyoxylase-like metal-dependent hydrolase (beta-lactamase superfamily II)